VLVTPLPGVDRRGLRAALRDLQTSVGNLRSSGLSTAYERLRAYLDWANDAIQTLSYQISAADVDRLVRTKGYETLLLGLGRFAATDDQRVVNGLLQVELEARVSGRVSGFAMLRPSMRCGGPVRPSRPPRPSDPLVCS
jgi:hypothetical protein